MVALAIGTGLCVTVPAVVRAPRLRGALLIGLLVTFVAARLAALLADGSVSVGSVGRLAAEGMIVAVVYDLASTQAGGLAQVAKLFRSRDAGYALVLDESSAARTVDAELARSRRHGTPLTFLVLEPTVGVAGEEFEAAVSRLSAGALAELERLYVHERSCQWISEQVRRSDLVVCSSAERFVVLSTDTTASGTAVLADRVVDAVRGDLGIELRPGIAEFPADGSTYGELIAVATSAAAGEAEPTPRIRPVIAPIAPVAPVDVDPPARRRVEADT